MNPYHRKVAKNLLPLLLAVLCGCGSPKPAAKAGKEIANAQEALANAKSYLARAELDKAAVEYSRANEIIAKGKALATSTESPQLAKLEEEALGGIAAVQQKKLEKEKADEEARRKEELAARFKRWRSRVAVPAAVDYLDVLPANSVVAGQLKNLGASMENAKKTAVGRLMISQELAPLWRKLEDAVAEARGAAGARAQGPAGAAEAAKNPAAALVQKAQFAKDLQLWLSRFNGQFAAAFWHLDLQNPAGMRAAAVVEITDPVPEAVMDELMEKTEFLPADAQQLPYKNVDIWTPGPVGPAVALLGRHLVVGPNAESVKEIVDGFIKPAGLGASAACASLKPLLGQKPEMLFFFDFEGYIREIGNMLGAMAGPGVMPALQKMMDASGENLKLLGMSSACVGDSFEDRSAAIIEGGFKGLAAIAIMPPEAPPPVNVLAFVPANAALATVGYMNGQAASGGLRDYLSAFKEYMDAIMKGMPRPPPGPNAPPGPPDFPAMLKAFEDKSGVNLDDLGSGIKGEFGFYVVLGPGLVLQPPDICMFLTCTTPEKAKAFNDTVSKAVGAYFTPSPVRELRRAERTLYQLDLQALGQLLGAALPPNFPYTPSWAIQGNRIFLASSPQALAKQLSYVDSNKTDAGLLTQPDFAKALNALKPEERKGQIMYLDMKTLLTAGATLGLPLLQAQLTDPEIKTILQGLPAPQVLFKDIPPMIMGSVHPLERVQVKNKLGEMVPGLKGVSVVRGPVPPVASVFLLGAGGAAAILSFQRAERTVPVRPPRPPGQF